MSLVALGLWTASLWLIIYAAKYLSERRRALLPPSQHRRPSTEVTVKHLSIRLKTVAFNAFHDELSSWLSPGKSRILRQILLRLYDLGSVLGVVGMLLGYCLLFLTAASLFSEILHAGPDSHTSTVTKRRLDSSGDFAPSISAPKISPIIPGLTVPLSHLPLILAALAISQAIHEVGHAVAAALHRIPVLSCGVAVTFLFPSAFVTLPSTQLEKLFPRDRLQIVSGGCFHNFVLLCFLLAVAWSGVGYMSTWILFQDISALGRLVVHVDSDSSLATHVPAGTLIVKVDDFSMSSTPSKDPWDHYLLSPSLHSVKGWCANNYLLNKALSATCISVGPYSCFVSKMDETIQYELDPIDIFTDNLARCNSSVECPPLSSCVVPRADQQLTRISIWTKNADANTGDIIVWKGPREEIWEQVQVGSLYPRFPLVTPKFPILASAFFEYMKMANLSLYLVNMLPISALDGYQFLVALLQLFGSTSDSSQSIDLEALSNTTRSAQDGRVQRACRAFLNFSTLLLVALCGLLGTISWMKQ